MTKSTAPESPQRRSGATADQAFTASNEGLVEPKPLAALFAAHSAELSGYLRKTYGDGPPDPEDIAQQAFLQLAKVPNPSSIQNLKAYLWRIARNLTLTEKRNSRTRSKYNFEVRHLYFAAEGTETDPERVLEGQEQLAVISEALKNMPERRRQAFLLHRIENLNLAAVGRQLGITRRAAVKHVMRAVVDIEAALIRQRDTSD